MSRPRNERPRWRTDCAGSGCSGSSAATRHRTSTSTTTCRWGRDHESSMRSGGSRSTVIGSLEPAAFLLPRLVRDMRRAGERARGLAASPPLAGPRAGDHRRADREHPGAARTSSSTWPSSSRGSRTTHPDHARRASSSPRREPPTSIDAHRALRGLHRVRAVPVGLSRSRRPTTATSDRRRSPAAQRLLEEPRGATVDAHPRLGGRPAARGAATPRSSAPRRARRTCDPAAADHGAARELVRRPARERWTRGAPAWSRRAAPGARSAPGRDGGRCCARAGLPGGAGSTLAARRLGHVRVLAQPRHGSRARPLPLPAPGRAVAAAAAARMLERFLELATSPVFLRLDMLLIFGLLVSRAERRPGRPGRQRRRAEPPEGAVLGVHDVRRDPARCRAAHPRRTGDGDRPTLGAGRASARPPPARARVAVRRRSPAWRCWCS